MKALPLLALLLACIGCSTKAPPQAKQPTNGGRAAAAPASLAAPSTVAAAAEPQPGEETGEGGPSARPSERHTFDLTKLQKFRFDKPMTSQQRLEGLLKYLKEEMANPSYPGIGPGGGPIDSGYIQLQMIGVLGHTVDPKDIAAARDKEADPAMRQRLTLALGRAGDRSVAQELAEILTHHPKGFMRRAAARGLHEVKAPSSKDALRAALADRYSAIGISDMGPPPGISKIYTVRREAAGALRALGEKVDPSVWRIPLDVGSTEEALSRLFDD